MLITDVSSEWGKGAGALPPTRGRRLGVVFALVILSTFVMAPSHGRASDLRWAPPAPHKDRLIAVVPGNFPPQYIVDDRGRPSGFAVDVMNAVAALAGVKVEYRVAENWAEATDLLLSGEVDLMPNAGISPARREFLDYTPPLEAFSIVFFARDASHFPNGLDDLAGRPIGVERTNVAYRLLKNRTDLVLDPHDSHQGTLFDLLAGRVDAIVGPAPVIRRIAADANVENRIRQIGEPLVEIKRAIAVRKGDTQLLNLLVPAVQSFTQSKAYQAIYVKWYGEPEPYWTVARTIWTGGALMLAVLIPLALRHHLMALKLNRQLRRSQSRLANAQRIGNIGNWDWDVVTGEVTWSDQVYRIVGLEPGAIEPSYDAFLQCVHPDDRQRVHKASEKSLQDRSPYAVGFRVVLPGGEERYVHEQGEVRHGAGRKPIRMVGTIQDVTEQKKSEEALQMSKARLEGILDIAPEAVISVDENQSIVLFNKGAESIFGYSAEEMLGRPLDLLLPEGRRDKHHRHFEAFMRSPEDARLMNLRGDVKGRKKDGTEFPAAASISKLKQYGEHIYTVMLHDITEEMRARQRIMELARFPDENPSPVLRVTEDGEVLYANTAARDSGAFFGDSDGDKLTDDLVEVVREVAAAGTRKEIELPLDDRVFSLMIKPVSEGAYINIYGRDVTEQETALRALRHGEKALQERVAQLEAAHQTLERQGADLVRFASDLQIARDEAETANRAKSQFLAAMSHELRTPLNAIIGFSQMMAGETFGPLGSPQYKGYIDDIQTSGQHLLDIINNILDLSKVESGADKLREEQVEVPKVVQDVVNLVNHLAEQAEVDLEIDLPGDLPSLRADDRKVKQILANLLSNAVKFTEPGGHVVVRAWCQPDSGFVFQVIDTGIGIAPDDIPKALSRFGQVDSDLNRKYEGTGLGLPLAKGLVEQHGGTLDLQSEVGVGTTVTVRFPASRVVSVEHDADPSDTPVREAG